VFRERFESGIELGYRIVRGEQCRMGCCLIVQDEFRLMRQLRTESGMELGAIVISTWVLTSSRSWLTIQATPKPLVTEATSFIE